MLSLFGLGPLLFLFTVNAHIQLPRIATLVFPNPRQPRGRLLLWIPILLLVLYAATTMLLWPRLEPAAALYLTGAAVLLLVVVLHPGEWLRGLGSALLAGPEGNPYLPPTTRLPLPFVRQRLLRRMRDDWPAAVADANRLALHSGQTTALLDALNRFFEELDEQQQLARLLDLADGLEGLTLFHLCGLYTICRSDTSSPFPNGLSHLRGTPGEIVWMLESMYQRQWLVAARVLAPITAGPGVADLAAGCEVLARYEQAQDWSGLAALPLLPARLLDDYPQLVEYRQLNGIVEAIGVIRDSASRSARSSALNRALGELRRIIARVAAVVAAGAGRAEAGHPGLHRRQHPAGQPRSLERPGGGLSLPGRAPARPLLPATRRQLPAAGRRGASLRPAPGPPESGGLAVQCHRPFGLPGDPGPGDGHSSTPLDLLHLLPPAIAHGLHGLTPWLLFLAAVLPAAVASLNGLRFQSECGRLAERSTLIGILLDDQVGDSALSPRLAGGRRQQVDALLERIVAAPSGADGQADLAAWSVDALMLSERIASDCVREVAEWTTLYDKPLPET